MSQPPQRIDALPAPWRRLVRAAIDARSHARAPYSHFAVGAAVLDAAGGVYPGCNVEISSYGLTICAERVALFAAVAAGVEAIEAIAVVGPAHARREISPCGACRQVIWDLAGDVPVLRVIDDERVSVVSAADLLPDAFGPDHLEPGGG